MATARKATSKVRTRDEAIVALQAYARTLAKTQHIADALGVSGKTARGRVRAGTLRTPEGIDTPPPVKVTDTGDVSLTDAHKDALVWTFAPQDDAACIALADKLAPTSK